jgi:hypothetical protein
MFSPFKGRSLDARHGRKEDFNGWMRVPAADRDAGGHRIDEECHGQPTRLTSSGFLSRQLPALPPLYPCCARRCTGSLSFFLERLLI